VTLKLTRSLMLVAIAFVLTQSTNAVGQQIPDQQFPDNTQNQNQNQFNQGTNTQAGGDLDGDVDLSEGNVNIEVSENTRNQGFVGATTQDISNQETGFIGAASEMSGPPLVDGQNFGGGVNQFTPTIPAANNNAAGGGGQQGFGGTGNGVTIQRRSLRARLRPSFYAPPVPGRVVSNRFQSHFSRQPGSQLTGQGYSVRVENRTAFINGTVNTRADSERLERQLRLEPGVYKIVNELSISDNANNRNPNRGTAPVATQPQFIQSAPIVESQIISAPQPVLVGQPIIGQPVISQPVPSNFQAPIIIQ